MAMHEHRNPNTLSSDAANAAVFDALADEDLQELADSIAAHGLINPISVRPDGRIIAGEQRWRAAVLAGMETVPVIVRDVTDEEAEELRIHENLRRRTLKPSETARAIRRLHELAGVRVGRPSDEEIRNSVPNKPTPQEEIARQTDYTTRQVRTLNTIADLIPSLAVLLDTKQITQKVAYQLAQLPAEDQVAIAALPVAALPTEPEAKALKAQLQERNREIDGLIAEQNDLRQQLFAARSHPPAPKAGRGTEPADAHQAREKALLLELNELRESKEAEIARLRRQKDTEIARLQKALEVPAASAPPLAPEPAPAPATPPVMTEAEYERKYHLSKLLRPLTDVMNYDLEEIHAAIAALPHPVLCTEHKVVLDRVIPWLQEYARMLGERTGRPNKIRSVK